jgi:hypothetical protein
VNIVMSALQTHPIAAVFPAPEGALFDALKADIRANGQYLPIILYDGMIWDGRARHRACAELGLKPWLVPLRRKSPTECYILSNYDRVGEPNSPVRKATVAVLSEASSSARRAEAYAQRNEWIRNARSEFENFVRGEREPCAVCGSHVDFVHAHHSFPLSLQFDCGIDEAVQDYQWLCPVHHKRVHALLSGYLLGSRDLSFLDHIPFEFTDEWVAIEHGARRGMELCYDALGRVPGEDKPRRYDPPYALFLTFNPGVIWRASEWKRSFIAAE